jgi:hypothetical protein
LCLPKFISSQMWEPRFISAKLSSSILSLLVRHPHQLSLQKQLSAWLCGVRHQAGQRALSTGPKDHTMSQVFSLLQVVRFWTGSENVKNSRQNAWELQFSPCSPEFRALCFPPTLWCIQGTCLGLDACCPCGHRKEGHWSKWEPAQPTSYEAPCSQQQLPIHKEGQLLK